VDVHLTTKATKDSVMSLQPDVVIWAAGGEVLIPDIQGISNNPYVLNAIEVLRQEPPLGDRVVVIGGGMVGLETAEFLAAKGKNITVLEKMDQAGNDIPFLIRRIILSNLQKLGVIVKTGIEICSINNNLVAIQGKADPVSASSIIVATGFKPKSLPTGVHYYKDKPVKFYAVGDCSRPARVLDAVRDGNKLAASL